MNPDYEVYYVKYGIWTPREPWHNKRDREDIRKFIGKKVFFEGVGHNDISLFKSRNGTVLCLPGDAIIAVVPIDTE